MLKVLGRVTSINVRKVLWTLDEMGVGYEREDWGKPIRDPNVAEFVTLNPNAQVPVIVDDGFVLWESQPILRYLGEKTGSQLWPREPKQRALVDQWMSWQAAEVVPAWGYVVQALLRNNPPNPEPARIEASIAGWGKAMRILDGQLEQTDGFVAGDQFSLADIVVGLSSHRWMSMSFDKPALPALEAHYAKMRSRPAAEAYLSAKTP
jgi:glutathione S-transferase